LSIRLEEPPTTRICIPDDLWSSSILPEGILECWLVADQIQVATGSPIAQLRIEGALHDLLAPAAGRLTQITAPGAVIDPGALIGEIR
jgi:hypothetical protein